MTVRIAASDYTFPKLEWEQALRLGVDLGEKAVDFGLFPPVLTLGRKMFCFALPNRLPILLGFMTAADCRSPKFFDDVPLSFWRRLSTIRSQEYVWT